MYLCLFAPFCSVSTTFRHPVPSSDDPAGSAEGQLSEFPPPSDSERHIYSRESQPNLTRVEKVLSALLVCGCCARIGQCAMADARAFMDGLRRRARRSHGPQACRPYSQYSCCISPRSSLSKKDITAPTARFPSTSRHDQMSRSLVLTTTTLSTRERGCSAG